MKTYTTILLLVLFGLLAYFVGPQVVYPTGTEGMDQEQFLQWKEDTFPQPKPLTIKEYAYQVAVENGHDPKLFMDVISCESGFNPGVDGDLDLGVSRGLVQIHVPSHPEVTAEQAYDPYWSIDWMVGAWNNDKQSWWSCWRMLK